MLRSPWVLNNDKTCLNRFINIENIKKWLPSYISIFQRKISSVPRIFMKNYLAGKFPTGPTEYYLIESKSVISDVGFIAGCKDTKGNVFGIMEVSEK